VNTKYIGNKAKNQENFFSKGCYNNLMNVINQINKSLLFLFIFTIISSALAYHIVVKAYDDVFTLSNPGI